MRKFWTFESVNGPVLVATDEVRSIGSSEREECTVRVLVGPQAYHGHGSLEQVQAAFAAANGGEE